MRHQRDLLEARGYDMLVVLDACRGDALKECAPRAVTTEIVQAVAPHTNIWVQQTGKLWESGYAYLTANPQINAMCARYGYDIELVNIWRSHYGYYTDKNIGAVHPVSTASVAVEWYRRSQSPCVVHFTQPHGPMIGGHPLCCHDVYGGTNEAEAVRNMHQDGALKPGAYAKAYKANLKLAWDAVQMLCRNINASVVVTADHGESLGEGGRIWHDSSATPDSAPELFRVPWLRIEAESRLPQQIKDRLRTQSHKGVENG